MKTRPYHYCIMKTGPSPSILGIQGITWFETEDLAWQYWGWLNEDYQNSIGSVACISEENLPYYFDCNSEYIKTKLTGTRLLQTRETAGIRITNDQKEVADYYRPSGPTQEMIDDNTIGIGELE